MSATLVHPCKGLEYTINCEYFVAKIFLDSLACAKIKRAKIYAQY